MTVVTSRGRRWGPLLEQVVNVPGLPALLDEFPRDTSDPLGVIKGVLVRDVVPDDLRVPLDDVDLVAEVVS